MLAALGKRRFPYLAVALATPAAFISITPILFLFFWAFCGTSTLGIFGHVTSRWFNEILSDRGWGIALIVSGLVSLISSGVGLYLAAATGFFVKLRLDGYEPVATCVILLPLLVPSVVYGLSMQYLGGRLAWPALITVLLADVALVLPIQYLVIRSAHGNIPLSQLEAALTLGATPRQALLRVYCPVMKRPLVAAWAFGFFTIIDEIVVLKFVWGASYEPTALKLWSLIGKTVNPYPAVIAIVILLVAVVTVMALLLRRYRDELAVIWGRFLASEP